jgi:hypothetical protein
MISDLLHRKWDYADTDTGGMYCTVRCPESDAGSLLLYKK